MVAHVTRYARPRGMATCQSLQLTVNPDLAGPYKTDPPTEQKEIDAVKHDPVVL